MVGFGQHKQATDRARSTQTTGLAGATWARTDYVYLIVCLFVRGGREMCCLTWPLWIGLVCWSSVYRDNIAFHGLSISGTHAQWTTGIIVATGLTMDQFDWF